MALKEGALSGNNGLVILRAQGNPVLFDGQGLVKNLGSSRWVTLFDLTGYTDRVFAGLSVYNSSSSLRLYIAFEQILGSEVKSVVVEPGASLSLDELSFGPGFRDPWAMKKVSYVRAIMSGTSGTAAAATATYASNITNGKQITIGANVYTFESAYGNNSPFNIPIGVSLAATLGNAVAAINAADPSVFASASATVLTVTSNFTGTGMNSYVFVDGPVATGGTFTGAGTLGGAGATAGAAGVNVDAMIW